MRSEEARNKENAGNKLLPVALSLSTMKSLTEDLKSKNKKMALSPDIASRCLVGQ